MSATIGDGGRTRDRVIAGLAGRLERAIDGSRRIFGKVLTRAQVRLRHVVVEHSPQDDEPSYYLRMVMGCDFSTPSDVAKHIDELKQPVTA